MIEYHEIKEGTRIAEILPGSDKICNAGDMLDIMAEASYNGAGSIIVYKESLLPEFFDLKTRIAGEILQKFSNYRMRLAIIGDFTEIKGNSLADFIRESNRFRTISFVGSRQEAVEKLTRI